MKETYRQKDYVLDPHGAVGLLALNSFMKPGTMGTFLATAHPRKFEAVIKKVIPDFPPNDFDLSACKKVSIANSYEDFLEQLEG